MSLIETSSGVLFDLLCPDPSMVRLSDMAVSLSRQGRFNGHTKFFYSVADHCLYVGDLLPPDLRLYGLLHDAHEAYLGDIVSPVADIVGKKLIDSLKQGIDAAIYASLGVPFPSQEIRDLVHRADLLALRIEAYHLLPSRGSWSGEIREIEEGSFPPLRLSTAFADSALRWRGEVGTARRLVGLSEASNER